MKLPEHGVILSQYVLAKPHLLALRSIIYAMNIQFIQLPPIRVVMIRHTGPYDQLAEAFQRLSGWVDSQNVPSKRWIGIYWDNPQETPAHQLRSAACVEVPLDFQLLNRGDLPLDRHEIAGGEYATTRYIGPYDKLEPVWTEFIETVVGPLARRISQNPAFEVYVNDPGNTPAEQLITELYMPVE